MPWAKLDDRFHENRKVKRVWRRCPHALGLHAMAITYCAGNLTDGLVDEDFVEEKIPGRRDREKATEALVDAGLWSPVEDGWMIHDFLDYNESRADVEAKRAAKAAAGRAGGRAKARNARETPATPPDSGLAPASGVLSSVAVPCPTPDPTRPDPNPINPPPTAPKGARRRDQDRFEEQMSAWAAEAFPDVSVKAVAGYVADAQMKGMDGDDLLAHVRRMTGIEAVA